MSEEFKKIGERFQSLYGNLSLNFQLLDIYEGNLIEYVLQDLKNQLSQGAFEQAKTRVAPINFLPSITQKRSRIYSNPPVRAFNLTDSDKRLLEYYSDNFKINENMTQANIFFNLFKNTAIEPYLYKGKPRMRVMPSNTFFTLAMDPVNPMAMTHFVKIMGQRTNLMGQVEAVLHVYTDDTFTIINQSGEVLYDMMNATGADGVNPYGKIPFVYLNKSSSAIMPKFNSDALAMTKLIPVILSDINTAIMFQCFSIFYGINIDEEDLKIGPNVFWRFKSDVTGAGEPKVGIIKPEVDSDKVMDLLKNQLGAWLQSMNIRASSLGQLTSENFASGISKVVDEMDTVQDMKSQVPHFENAEKELWDLLINHLHPVWRTIPDFEEKVPFSPGASVQVVFQELTPKLDQQQEVNVVVQLYNNGLISKRQAIKRLNPNLNDLEIEVLLKEMNEDRTILLPDTNVEEINGDETPEI